MTTLEGTPDGGYVTRIKSDIFDFTQFFSNVEVESFYGATPGNAGAIFRTENNIDAVIDIGGRGSFVHLDYGTPRMNDAGQLAYSTRIAAAPQASALFTDFSMWVDDRMLVREGDATDPSLGLSGSIWTRTTPIGIASDGRVTFYGDYTNDGEAIVNQGIFSVAADGTGWQTLLKSGDVLGVSGSVVPVSETASQDFISDLSNAAVSTDGTRYLSSVDVETGTTTPTSITELVVDGNAQVWDGTATLVKSFVTIPASVGGLPGESLGTASQIIDGFDQVDVNDSGSYIFGGFTNLDDDLIVLDGQIIHREGDELPRFGGEGGTVTLGSDAKTVAINNDGDYAFSIGGTGNSQLVLNGEVVMASGDLLATENTLGIINNVILSDRDENDQVIVRFLGRETGQSSFSTQLYELVLQLDASGLLGDYDLSGVLDIADVDLLVAAIIGGSTDPEFDLDGSNVADSGDLAEWVEVLFGSALGDSNLDGSVDLIDLSALASNFGGSGTYGQGDFNADGVVDLIDLSTLATSFGFSAAVPEPASAALLGLGLLGAGRRRSA
ncbi:MAG: PEP-CTERM sorting domain-containing protein [Phycisphaeraceae bacterium]